jgi:NAD-dependent DNA ligase
MIKELLDKASAAYYAGTPIISDEEFDSLAEKSGYNKVGADAVKGVPHFFRMYSLQKVHYGEELLAPVLDDPYQTPKLDGAAISMSYYCNPGEDTFHLNQILTRGDGIKGLDVTAKLRHLVPAIIQLPTTAVVVQINAELVAPKTIENARNYAAGAMNLKSVEEVKTRDLTVVAYDCQPYLADTYYDSLGILWTAGFKTVKAPELEQKFPLDGFVVRENSNDKFAAAGHTSKHPRAAYALKPKPTAVTTKLIDVEWQVGRTGVVSPVAILEPVLVGDATVSRATLHNIEYIRGLGLEIGCTVELIRSGEIIPRIVGRVDSV